jgi:hypothetical protein
VLILLTPVAKAQTKLDLSPKRQEYLAEKIKQNDLCQRDLTDCKAAIDDIPGGTSPALYVAGGALVGMVLTLVACSLAKCGGSQ